VRRGRFTNEGMRGVTPCKNHGLRLPLHSCVTSSWGVMPHFLEERERERGTTIQHSTDVSTTDVLQYCNRRVDDVFVRSQRIHDVSYCHTVIRFTSKTYSYTTQFTHSSCQTLMPTYLNCVYVFRQTSGVMGWKSFYYHMTTYSYSTTLYYCREHIPVQCCAPVLLGASVETRCNNQT
jgi:hypothetical protein